MKTFEVSLFILLMTISQYSLAASDASNEYSFQTYFANTRQCLSSDKIEACLPPRLDSIISKPADDYTRDQFVNLVITDSSFRHRVSSCFAISAKIITVYGTTKLFRSEQYACEVMKIGGAWKLTAFYNFSSNE